MFFYKILYGDKISQRLGHLLVVDGQQSVMKPVSGEGFSA